MNSHALPSFWKCYEELPGHAKKLANKNFVLFKANPQHPSLGFQKRAVFTPLKSVAATAPSPASGMANITGFGSALTRPTTTSSFDDERFASSKELIKRDP